MWQLPGNVLSAFSLNLSLSCYLDMDGMTGTPPAFWGLADEGYTSGMALDVSGLRCPARSGSLSPGFYVSECSMNASFWGYKRKAWCCGSKCHAMEQHPPVWLVFPGSQMAHGEGGAKGRSKNQRQRGSCRLHSVQPRFRSVQQVYIKLKWGHEFIFFSL